MELEQVTVTKKEKLRDLLGDFIKELDSNLKFFCKKVRGELRNEFDNVIAVTGYPGYGKSQLGSIIGLLIDYNYEFYKNICFIPSSKDIEERYMGLPIYSVLHVDEASKGLHKQKWYEKVQQKLNQLFDVERENHFLCTIVIMPRFQNFTENFRNFRIKYWINIPQRGIGVVYKRDEDKDAKDPWHIDENYKIKEKKWRGRRIFERDVGSLIRMEQATKNYWFYFKIPEIPKEIWAVYQHLKSESRKEKEEDFEIESWKEKLEREKTDRWNKVIELKRKGYTNDEIGALIGVVAQTVRRDLRAIEAYERMHGKLPTTNINSNINLTTTETKSILNKSYKGKKNEIPEEFDNIAEK